MRFVHPIAPLRRAAGEALRARLAKQNRFIIQDMESLGRPRRVDVHANEYTNDYIRLSQLDLAVQELYESDTAGAIAELGVYKGHFAAVMNAALPDRTLYLFDTFEGFSAEEEEADRRAHGGIANRDFSDTSVSHVLGRMKHPDRCVVRKGLFPDTAAGLEGETFALVSIDTDLSAPIYAGLNFFWDRLAPGGFIFVHDYNYSPFPGARTAVRQFARERGVPFVPMPDADGSAAFRKGFQ